MKIISIVIILMMIYEDTVLNDCIKIIFNFPGRSRNALMKVESFKVDMEEGFPNPGRTVNRKGIK